MNNNIIKKYKFKIGSQISIYSKSNLVDKNKIQIFSGILISKKGKGINEMITVRGIYSGEIVEKIISPSSPMILKITFNNK